MMKKLSLTLLMALFALAISAQIETLEPGFYAEENDSYVPLKPEFSVAVNAIPDLNDSGFTDSEIACNVFQFKGKTSINSSSTGSFIFVGHPKRKSISQTRRKYNVFTRDMNPDNMLLVPLDVVKKRREYDARRATLQKGHAIWPSVDFEWEQLGKNTFRITTDLPDGEYAFVFRFKKNTSFNFNAAYTFSLK